MRNQRLESVGKHVVQLLNTYIAHIMKLHKSTQHIQATIQAAITHYKLPEGNKNKEQINQINFIIIESALLQKYINTIPQISNFIEDIRKQAANFSPHLFDNIPSIDSIYILPFPFFLFYNTVDSPVPKYSSTPDLHWKHQIQVRATTNIATITN